MRTIELKVTTKIAGLAIALVALLFAGGAAANNAYAVGVGDTVYVSVPSTTVSSGVSSGPEFNAFYMSAFKIQQDYSTSAWRAEYLGSAGKEYAPYSSYVGQSFCVNKSCVTETKSDFEYKSVTMTDFQKAVVNAALNVYNSWPTKYSTTLKSGVEDSDGQYPFSCSTFVYYAIKNAMDPVIPFTSGATALKLSTTDVIFNRGYANEISLQDTTLADIQPGDLLFFDTTGDGNVNHTGIYLGNNEFIHSNKYTFINDGPVTIMPLTENWQALLKSVKHLSGSMTKGAEETAYISAYSTPLRSEAAVDAGNVIKTLSRGAAVEVLYTNDNWAYVTSGETKGFVSVGLISTQAPVQLSACTVTLSYSTAVFNGSAKKPTVVVKYKGTVVPASKYSLSYSNFTYPGIASVKITSSAYPYVGTVTKTYTIKPAAPKFKSANKYSKYNSVIWNWVSGSKGYYVYRAIGTGAWKKVATTTSTSYKDYSVKKGKTYKYKVVAFAKSNGKIITSAASAVKTLKR